MRIPQIRLYQEWLSAERGLTFASYEDLWRWSVTDLEAFWKSLWDFHGIRSSTPFERVLTDERMPGAKWFDGAHLNFVHQVFRHADAAEAAGQPAIISDDELGRARILGWRDLKRKVASLAMTLRSKGVGRGDRVAAYLPNTPEAVIAMLACASLGAIWSVCSPDMGAPAVLDRFRQIAPRVLFAADGVHYAGRKLDRSETISALCEALPSLETLILLQTQHAATSLGHALDFDDAASADGGDFEPEWLPFDHPLWIVYSSGTTGLPKPLVHSHGGIVLGALAHQKHIDLGASYDPNSLGERYHWYSSTGWIMWNAQLAGLLSGTTICLFDGSPGGSRERPDWGVLWRFAGQNGVTFFGAGANFYSSCMKAALPLGECADLSRVRALGSTGSPLHVDVQDWATAEFARMGNPGIWWCNLSGGTDICGAFVTANPELQPAPGRMQCRQLGASVEAWDETGRPLVEQVGELVCTRPLPNMPACLWGDGDGSRYHEAYFDTYPGIWRHGDWLTIHADGSCTISGRSDATINRGGLRIGTSEIYAAVERLPEIADALVIDLDDRRGDSRLLMFVALQPDVRLDGTLRSRIVSAIRSSLSPRFIPDEVIEAPGIPRTLSGKRQEVPIKRLLQGGRIDKVISRDGMANPEVLEWYGELAFARASTGSVT